MADDGAMNSSRVALFIDVDNVLILAQNSGLPFDLSLIIERARQQGTVMSSKAYADWTAPLLLPVLGDFRASAVELVQLPTSIASREHKNTADIQLAVDALEMVFSPARPDIIVIVGGDRDFVPLVQKLRRYGIFVMGIGVEAGVSNVLVEACDAFVYYDDMAPPPPEETAEPVSLPDPVEAYALMRRAVVALRREGRPSTGASVLSMMRQLAPAFDLGRYKTTMKELAHSAEESAYVRVIENPGSDFVLAEGSDAATAPQTPQPIRRQYDYSSIAASTASYRTILQERRIPLLPWRTREEFIRLMWRQFSERKPNGISLDEMRDALLEYASVKELGVSQPMIQKLLYTLNFANCFSYNVGSSYGRKIDLPYDFMTPIYPGVEADAALRLLHRQYLEVLVGDDAILHPEAAFNLLYGDEVSDEDEIHERTEELTRMCGEIRPLSSLARAFLEASQAGRSGGG